MQLNAATKNEMGVIKLATDLNQSLKVPHEIDTVEAYCFFLFCKS